MAAGYYIAPNDLETYQNLVRNFTSNTGTEGLPQVNDELEFYYVKLDADLTATTDDSTPTTVDASVYYPQDDDTLADSGENIEITNRFNVEASSGDLLLVIYQHGEYIPLFASGGGGGGECDCSCCSAATNTDLIHPQLPAGKDETVKRWTFTTEGSIMMPNTTGNAFMTLGASTGTTLVYDSGDHTFKLDVASSVTVENSAGTDITPGGGLGVRATNLVAEWVMDWSTSPPQIELSMDCDYTP